MTRTSLLRRRALYGFGGMLVCALLFLGGVYKIFSQQDRALEQAVRAAQTHTVPVVVATETLYAGFEIRLSDLTVVQMPPELAPGDATGSPTQLVGRVPAERILAHDPIREGRLADFGASRGLSALIPDGYRALSLPLVNAPAGAGFLLPGDRVDMQVTADLDGVAETFLLLENVMVLAVDGSMTEEARKKGKRQAVGTRQPAITLLLTPEDAAAATHAHQEGEVSLAMRSPVDLGTVAVDGVTLRGMLGRATLAEGRVLKPRIEERPRLGEVEIILGPNRHVETYPLEDGDSVGL